MRARRLLTRKRCSRNWRKVMGRYCLEVFGEQKPEDYLISSVFQVSLTAGIIRRFAGQYQGVPYASTTYTPILPNRNIQMASEVNNIFSNSDKKRLDAILSGLSRLDLPDFQAGDLTLIPSRNYP